MVKKMRYLQLQRDCNEKYGVGLVQYAPGLDAIPNIVLKLTMKTRADLFVNIFEAYSMLSAKSKVSLLFTNSISHLEVQHRHICLLHRRWRKW